MGKAVQVPQDVQDAVSRFARGWGHGRRPPWRVLLRHAWETGDYGLANEADVSLLQQARNIGGPSWLKRFKPVWAWSHR